MALATVAIAVSRTCTEQSLEALIVAVKAQACFAVHRKPSSLIGVSGGLQQDSPLLF